MKLSIIIPAYNERATIREIIERIQRVELKHMEKEIIVVDDGSKDGTREILQTTPGIHYIFHQKNLGKGGAVKTGLQHASGNILILQDADLEYDPQDYAQMIRPILEKQTELTLGIRINLKKDKRRKKSLYWISWIANHLITWTTNILYCNNAGEYEGCYKAFTRRLMESISIQTNGFDFDNELVCKALKAGFKTVDVPIHYYPRSYEEGKKINWKDGFKILWTIFKFRFKH